MDGINWPLWIIAFSVLLIAIALSAVLASLVVVLKKVGSAADAVGFTVSQAGSAIRRKFSRTDPAIEPPVPSKGSVIRGLSIVSAVAGALLRLARRKKGRAGV